MVKFKWIRWNSNDSTLFTINRNLQKPSESQLRERRKWSKGHLGKSIIDRAATAWAASKSGKLTMKTTETETAFPRRSWMSNTWTGILKCSYRFTHIDRCHSQCPQDSVWSTTRESSHGFKTRSVSRRGKRPPFENRRPATTNWTQQNEVQELPRSTRWFLKRPFPFPGCSSRSKTLNRGSQHQSQIHTNLPHPLPMSSLLYGHSERF